jgi:hypothetical protein
MELNNKIFKKVLVIDAIESLFIKYENIILGFSHYTSSESNGSNLY